jgi:hypothetical protein
MQRAGARGHGVEVKRVGLESNYGLGLKPKEMKSTHDLFPARVLC